MYIYCKYYYYNLNLENVIIITEYIIIMPVWMDLIDIYGPGSLVDIGSTEVIKKGYKLFY